MVVEIRERKQRVGPLMAVTDNNATPTRVFIAVMNIVRVI
jgi:hypothetical protein